MTPLRAAVKADEDEATLWTPRSTGSSRKPSLLSPADRRPLSVCRFQVASFFHIFYQDSALCVMWRLVKDAPCGGFQAMSNV